MNILAPKNRGPSDGPPKQNDFLKNGSNNFDYISAIYGDDLPK
jgi:hypothetical protein